MKREKTIAPTLPHSDDSEQAVLGSVILKNKSLNEIGFLEPEHFFHKANQIIFRAMLVMKKNCEEIDIITLPDKLMRDGNLEEAGGVVYLASLASGMPVVRSIKQYAKIVFDKFTSRSLIGIMEAVQEIAFSESVDPNELILQAFSAIVDVKMKREAALLEVKDFRKAAISQMSNSEENSVYRINTGIEKLDLATGGFRPGELITVTAGTGVGKTLLAQQIRRFACSQGLHSLYCSAEMTAEQLAAREIATEANVPHWKMRQPERLTKDEYTALVETSVKECDKCEILDGEISLRRIWSAAHLKKHKSELHCLIIDYDELIDAPGKDEFQQQRNLVRGAKALAVSLCITVIMISQLRKPLDAKEAKKPTLERLYGTGAKSKHSSTVIFIDREYVRELKGDETKARICILKSRDGRICEIPATFNLSTLRFREENEEERYTRSKKHPAKEEEPKERDDF